MGRWGAEDVDPWETVRVFFHPEHKPDGTVVEAYWLRNFASSTAGPRSVAWPRAVTALSISIIIMPTVC